MTGRGATRKERHKAASFRPLANIYLNLMDRNFRKQVAAGNLEGWLVRYSDDSSC